VQACVFIIADHQLFIITDIVYHDDYVLSTIISASAARRTDVCDAAA
jgi:hypothetical protein